MMIGSFWKEKKGDVKHNVEDDSLEETNDQMFTKEGD